MQQNNNIIQIKNLNKFYNKNKVIDNVSLTIPKFSIYSLLGINGAGKSTIMKIITGIITHYSGTILINGQNFERKFLKNIGSLIEHPSLYSNLTAVENLKIVCLQEGINSDKIPKILIDVGLSNLEKSNKTTKDFSLGMKQRLGIASALIKDPDLLILDEPFNGLDPYGVDELKTFFKKLVNTGKSIMISSHILSELENITDNIGILHNGKLVYENQFATEENLKEIFFNYTKEECYV